MESANKRQKRQLGIYKKCVEEVFNWLEETVDDLDKSGASLDDVRSTLIAIGQRIEDCNNDVKRGRMLPGNVNPGEEWLAETD